MSRLPLRELLLLAIGGLLTGCQGTQPAAWDSGEGSGELPAPPREFRGAWIATVDNIDWPSEPGLPVDRQKAELRRMLDQAAALNLNAVLFQVRPHADALYDSPHEPWSSYLTGTQGQAPEPFYDPLAFAVEEAHKRGLALHAWFNPFRAGHPADSSEAAPNHVGQIHPEWVRSYGAYQWLDPGVPEARAHSRAVILDVVRRYDIDGVHFDDYFYPYPSYADGAPFPDSASWARARRAGWTGSRDDWRRHNVDQFIEKLYRTLKEVDPQVAFGVSPFGIWRPNHPPGTEGFDAYAELYADARKWVRKGWLDYVVPQLYYRIDQPGYSYPSMLRWWADQNVHDRHVWPGLYASRVGMEGEAHWSERQILGQLYAARSHPDVTGQVYFSMQALMPPGAHNADGPAGTPPRDPISVDSVFVGGEAVDSVVAGGRGVDSVIVRRAPRTSRPTRATARLLDRLSTEAYAEPALLPASPWLDDDPPARPVVTVRERPERLVFTMQPDGNETVRWWVVRRRYGADWTIDFIPGTRRTYALTQDSTAWPDLVAISAVDPVGNEGPPVALRRWAAREERRAPEP